VRRKTEQNRKMKGKEKEMKLEERKTYAISLLYKGGETRGKTRG
jgi:hypothetical protein